jgi:hypothetical protein
MLIGKEGDWKDFSDNEIRRKGDRFFFCMGQSRGSWVHPRAFPPSLLPTGLATPGALLPGPFPSMLGPGLAAPRALSTRLSPMVLAQLELAPQIRFAAIWLSLFSAEIVLPYLGCLPNYMFCYVISRERLIGFSRNLAWILCYEGSPHSFFSIFYNWQLHNWSPHKMPFLTVPSISGHTNCWCCHLSVSTWTIWCHIHRKIDDIIASTAICQWSNKLFMLPSVGDHTNYSCRHLSAVIELFDIASIKELMTSPMMPSNSVHMNYLCCILSVAWLYNIMYWVMLP